MGSSLNIINNDLLQSLSGLENISPASILDLNIHNNPQLSGCHVNSICDYLIAPSGTVNVHDNASGCNSQDEIELGCWSANKEIAISDKFTISPNPNTGTTKIRIWNKDQGLAILELFDISGIKIKELMKEELLPRDYEVKVDLRDLPAGVYYCVLRTTHGIITNKLIKL